MYGCSATIVAIAIAGILMLLPGEATEIPTRWPGPKMDQHERALSSGEVAKSACTNLARKVVGGLPGVVTDSEKASLSPEFGHIYRYDILNAVEYSGKTHRVHTIVVLSSKDCEAAHIATYPTFELPGASSQK